MGTVDDLLQTSSLVVEIEEALNDPDQCVYRITGPAGSGKSTVAAEIGAKWQDANGAAVLALGDDRNYSRHYFPFLSGLVEVNDGWGKLAMQGSRSALKVLDVLQGTG
ncbi:MAG: hypothetical protein AAF197_11900, partial [Pseudomonadota bacterium]